jgi:hypothetical protein
MTSLIKIGTDFVQEITFNKLSTTCHPIERIQRIDNACAWSFIMLNNFSFPADIYQLLRFVKRRYSLSLNNHLSFVLSFFIVIFCCILFVLIFYHFEHTTLVRFQKRLCRIILWFLVCRYTDWTNTLHNK